MSAMGHEASLKQSQGYQTSCQLAAVQGMAMAIASHILWFGLAYLLPWALCQTCFEGALHVAKVVHVDLLGAVLSCRWATTFLEEQVGVVLVAVLEGFGRR